MIDDDESKAYEGWAVVELLGRRRYAGRVSEVVQFGVAMGRLDVPETDEAPAQTIFFAGASVYQLSPCSEEAARAVAQHSRPEPVYRWELTPPTRAIEGPARRPFDEPGYEPPYDEDEDDSGESDDGDDEDDPNEYQPDGRPRDPFAGATIDAR